MEKNDGKFTKAELELLEELEEMPEKDIDTDNVP